MRKLHNIAAILAATIALAGCGATGVKVSDAQVAAFKPGETTEAQVAALLGQPNHLPRCTGAQRAAVLGVVVPGR